MEEGSKFKIKCRGIILHKDKLFVVKHGEHMNFYALPGGHLEFPENPKECLEREIIEELGIKPEIGKLLYINSYQSDDGFDSYFEFVFEIKNGIDFANIEKFKGTHNFELFDIQWVDRNSNLKVMPEEMFQDFKKGEILTEEVKFVT